MFMDLFSLISFFMTASALKSDCYSGSCGDKRQDIEIGVQVFPGSQPRPLPCKGIAAIDCFISKCCSSIVRNQLYSEFDRIGSFYEVIPLENPSALMMGTGDARDATARLIESANSAQGYANFDSLYNFFYNADVCAGLKSRNFDSSYLTWYLNRFSFFLNKYLCSEGILSVDPEQGFVYKTKCDGKATVLDLVCLPTPFRDYSYGDQALPIFNAIISNTITASIVTEFNAALISQVKSAYKSCASVGEVSADAAPSTTLSVYYDTLMASLSATQALIIGNVEQKRQYLRPKYITTFAAIPYISTAPVAPSTLEIPQNKTAFVVIPESAVKMPMIIDFN